MPHVERASPKTAHLGAIAAAHRYSASAHFKIFYQPASFIVEAPVLQKMQPRRIQAVAVPSAVTVHLDHGQQVTRRVSARFQFEHARESESHLVESPTIHAEQVDRRRLDTIIDLKSKTAVRSSEQSFPH